MIVYTRNYTHIIAQEEQQEQHQHQEEELKKAQDISTTVSWHTGKTRAANANFQQQLTLTGELSAFGSRIQTVGSPYSPGSD